MTPKATHPPVSTPPDGDEPGTQRQPVIESAELFQGTNEVVIRHSGRDYRLRRTRFDKLILTA